MAAYYNEIDPYAAQWLRNLIAAGHIAPGDVDERSIVDVRPDDLAGYEQCHFFAGIGGWSVALRLAGWPDDRPVWTGSCPCQPFSAAGAGKAADDERHLWPAWFPLIRERRPAIVFGEQVEAAIGWGWLDAVFADLEGEGYACGASVLPACGVGAPHIRQRSWFVADADGGNTGTEGLQRSGEHGQRAQDGGLVPLANPGHDSRPAWTARGEHQSCASISEGPGGDSAHGTLADAAVRGRGPGLCDQESPEQRRPVFADSRGVADSECDGGRTDEPQREAQGRAVDGRLNPWRDWQWIECSDGKARPIEPGITPLAHGIRNRMGRLRAYGNAIVPQVAAEFIAAAVEAMKSSNLTTE